MVKYRHYELNMVEPTFGSKLTDLIIELDYLRKKPLGGSTRPEVFFQLKNIFHTLESIGSARIEGNRTTIAEYIETKMKNDSHQNEGLREINNLEKCMSFIDENIAHTPINRIFVSELHKHVVENLNSEGSKNPGQYRQHNVKITGAEHAPPDVSQVGIYMQELFDFINNDASSKYDLLKAALAHHRFAWIHPFDNGNGRTVRLITYAMLIKQGFNVQVGRIINPTAIFCSDRNQYYSALALADSGKNQDLLCWCEYMLTGLKQEIEKIDKLLEYTYLKKNILAPMISFSLDRKFITPEESKILLLLVEKQVIQASDLKSIMPNKISASISRYLRALKEKKMILPVKENARKYVLRFDNNYLLRGLIAALSEKGFLPLSE